MIIEGEFFADGHLRWNFGWPTPNYAGAFLATLLALAFAFSNSRWRWPMVAAEAGGLFLLAKTYSRGAVVAWGLAWLFGVMALRVWNDPVQRLVWLSRMAALGAMMFAAGFGWNRAEGAGNGTHSMSANYGLKQKDSIGIKQSAEEPATEDGSVVNRLAIWRGGLKMIAAAPLTGWGAGESGRAYMNWFQDIDRHQTYTTIVNSYLHVAVEHGLPVLGGVLFGLGWFLAVAWRSARSAEESCNDALRVHRSRAVRTETVKRPALMMAMGASLVAWMVANIFTTLWIEPRLWIVPAAVGFGLGWNAWKIAGLRLASLMVVSLVVAFFVVGGLYGTGRWLMRDGLRPIFPGTSGSVVLRSTKSASAIWHVWPDPTVLGPTPGKELRRLLDVEFVEATLIVYRAAPSFPAEIPTGAGVILFGVQADLMGRGFLPDSRRLWIIHPLVPPPSGKMSNQSSITDTVILPQIDEIGNGLAWRRWAGQNGFRVVESPGSGLDIRAVWPAVMSWGDTSTDRLIKTAALRALP